MRERYLPLPLRVRILLAGTMGLSFIAAGCLSHVPPQTAEVPVPVPASFSSSAGRGDPSLAISHRWWEDFGSDELNQIVGRALKGNLGVKQAVARMEQAEALARKAGASLWPSLSGEARASRIRKKALSVTGGLAALSQDASSQRVITQERQYQGGLIAGYEIDLWGRVRNTRLAALHTWHASQEDLSAIALILPGQVTEVWFNLLEQRAQERLQAEQLQINEKFLSLMELRFSQGLAAATDVFGQRQIMAATKARAPLIRARIKTLEHQLAVLAGLPPQTSLSAGASDLPKLPPLPGLGIPADLIQRRPDVRAARLRLAAADRTLAVAIADQFPALRLSSRFIRRP